MNGKNVIIIRVAEKNMGLLFHEGATVRVMSGIPRDAKLLGVKTNWAYRTIEAMFEHPSFPFCEEGVEPETRWLGLEWLEHPMADTWDMIPLRIGMDYQEHIDMQKWICRRAAEIEGRAYEGP